MIAVDGDGDGGEGIGDRQCAGLGGREERRGDSRRADHVPGQVLIGRRGRFGFGDLGVGPERQHGQGKSDLLQGRMLGPVVRTEQNAEIASPQPVRHQLGSPEIVVLVVVDRQPVNGIQANAKRRDRNDDRRKRAQ